MYQDVSQAPNINVEEHMLKVVERTYLVNSHQQHITGSRATQENRQSFGSYGQTNLLSMGEQADHTYQSCCVQSLCTEHPSVWRQELANLLNRNIDSTASTCRSWPYCGWTQNKPRSLGANKSPNNVQHAVTDATMLAWSCKPHGGRTHSERSDVWWTCHWNTLHWRPVLRC